MPKQVHDAARAAPEWIQMTFAVAISNLTRSPRLAWIGPELRTTLCKEKGVVSRQLAEASCKDR